MVHFPLCNIRSFQSLFLATISLQVLNTHLVYGQGEPQDIRVPQRSNWLREVDLSSVPDTPIRAVGSGVCENAVCDGEDNDRCFESCGNAPSPTDVYGCPRDHQWALTFDDGPSTYTAQLLDILDKYNIKATFCVMGDHVKKFPGVLKRAFESGHQIASHTYSHPHLMSLSNEEIIYEVKATEEAIKDAIGIKPKYLRPPFGEADDRVKALLRAMGYKVLLWNVDPTDYDVYMMQDVSKRIQGAFRLAAAGNDTGLNAHEDPGFISLQHGEYRNVFFFQAHLIFFFFASDLYRQSIDQVPKIIDHLLGIGYKFTTVAECVDDDSPHDLLERVEAARASHSSNAIESGSDSGSNSASPSSSSSSASISPPSLPQDVRTKAGATKAVGARSGLLVSVAFICICALGLF
ncbi:chitin deacetylase [Apophysomyces sp. BC1034]|nr:chitin deacetylase [Apophysomyces sp. BC1015]KAG0176552.1 chitin deacetylase [Apophysomyces sp. BC1021]KAG0186919.1 chitin deacetylase [Apophysomyces sp. BC1034]